MREIRRTPTGFVHSADWMFALHARKRIERRRAAKREARRRAFASVRQFFASLVAPLVRVFELS